MALLNSNMAYACSTPGGYIAVGSNAPTPYENLSEVPGLTFPLNNVKFHVIGGFQFDMNVSLIGCDIIVDEEGLITIEENIDVSFSDCALSSCDDFLWWGILFRTGARIRFDCSVIEDAYTGFYLWRNNRIAVANSLFENNYIGIHGTPFYTLDNTLTVRYFTGNTFRTNGTLKDSPYELPFTTDGRGYAGIFLENIGYFPVKGNVSVVTSCSELPLKADNHFENLHSGIIAYKTSLDVTRTTFKEIMHSPMNGLNMGIEEVDDCIYINGDGGSYFLRQQGLGKNNATFTMDNCQTGIQSKGLVSLFSIQNKMNTPKIGFVTSNHMAGECIFHNNNMDIGNWGFLAYQNYNATSMQMYNNRIRMTTHTDPPEERRACFMSQGPVNGSLFFNTEILFEESDHDVSRGIDAWLTPEFRVYDVSIELEDLVQNFEAINISNSYMNQVYENLIKGYTDDGWNSWSAGIVLENSFGTNVWCNFTRNVNWGMFLNFNCDYSPMVNNYFRDHGKGLFYNFGASNAPRQVNVGNHWAGDFDVAAAENAETDQMLIAVSGFDVHTDQLPYFPDPLIQNGAWFDHIQSLPEPEILCAEITTWSPSVDEDYLTMIVVDSLYPVVDFRSGRQFWAQWHLYGAMNADLFTSASTAVNDWYSDMENEPIGQLYAVYQATAQPLSAFTPLLSDLHTNVIDKQSIADDILTMQDAYATTIDTLWSTIDDSIVVLMATLNAIVLDGKALRHGVDSIYESVITGLISNVQSISCTALQDSNLQKVLYVQLNSLNSGSTSLTTNQRNALRSVADQCPFIGGPAVSMARTILMQIDGYEYWDDDAICYPPAPLVSSLDQMTGMKINVSVWPNPAIDGLHVSLTDQDRMITQWKVYTMQGQLVGMSDQVNTAIIQLPTAHLAQGTYLLRILDDAGTVSVTTFTQQ